MLISSISLINCSSSVDAHYIDCNAIAGFQITSGGGPVFLFPSEHHTVCVTFTPHEAATFSGFVQILSNAAPALVELHGTGDACTPQQMTLSQSYMSFGDLCVGKSAGPLCFTITNTGGAPLVISSIGFINCSSSVDAHYIDCNAIAGFQISSGGGGGTLPVGGSRTVCLTFTPHEAATFSGFLVINTNAPTGPTIIQLHGTGDACPS